MITLTGIEPAAGSTRNNRNCLIEFTLLDENNVGINSSTLIVEVSGIRAVEGADFKQGFAGPYSEINIDIDTLGVIINRETDYLEDSVLEVKIQIQDFNNKYYSSFKNFICVENETLPIINFKFVAVLESPAAPEDLGP